MMSVPRTGVGVEGIERAIVVAEGPTVLGHDEEIDVLVVEGLTGFLDGLVLASASALLPTVTAVGSAPLGREVVLVEVVLLADLGAEDGEVAEGKEGANLVLGVVVVKKSPTDTGRIAVGMNVYCLNRPISIDDSNV